MRFAGSAIEDFMGSSPNYGELGTANAANKGREQIASIYGDAKVAGMGMSQAAETEAHGLITEAQGKLGAAQQQASNMSQMGGLLGQGIGGLGGLFKGGGQAAANVNAGYSPGLGIPFADFENYGYDPRG